MLRLCASWAVVSATISAARIHQYQGTHCRSSYKTVALAGLPSGLLCPVLLKLTKHHFNALQVALGILGAVSDIGPINVVRLHPDATLPQRAHHDDAGVDLTAVESVTIEPGQRVLVATGLAFELPLGTVGLIHPRSGLALRQGLSIVNTPGTVDAGFRGEVKVCLINLDPDTPISINKGERIAQLLVQKVELCDFRFVDSFADGSTSRGAAGYGSTGV